MKRLAIAIVAVIALAACAQEPELSDECLEHQILYQRMELVLDNPDLSQANLLYDWPADCPLPAL